MASLIIAHATQENQNASVSGSAESMLECAMVTTGDFLGKVRTFPNGTRIESFKGNGFTCIVNIQPES